MKAQLKKRAAPEKAEAVSRAGAQRTNVNLQDCTPTPEEGQEKFYKSLESLPAEMREKLTREYQKMISESLQQKELIEKISGKMLTKGMMIQLLKRRANGEKFEIDPNLFTEPFKHYWQALENSAHGKEADTLLMVAGESEGKLILEAKANTKHYPALAEFQDQIKDVTWFWDYRIPNGKMTILGGEGGVSKSMLAQRICYMQIHDRTFPDGTPIHNPGAPVLYVDCEGFAAGMKVRAEAWGMDTSKFNFWSVDFERDGFIDFSKDTYKDELIERIYDIPKKPALIVIDSLGNASSGGQDKVEDVRPLLNFFNQIAYNFDLAVILVAHTRKPPAMLIGKGEITQDDIRGSGHLINMARSAIGVWQVQTEAEPDPNGPRIMAVIKSNYAKKPKPIGYEVLSDVNGNPKIFFGDAPKPYKEPTKTQACAEWMIETLTGEGKPMKPKELETMALQEGFRRGIFYEAHRRLEKDGKIKDTHDNKNPENAWELT